jgi:hypothetical protein
MKTDTPATIAKSVVEVTKSQYGGAVWNYANPLTRKGWVARHVVTMIAPVAPDTPASDIAAILKACDAIIDAEGVYTA